MEIAFKEKKIKLFFVYNIKTSCDIDQEVLEKSTWRDEQGKLEINIYSLRSEKERVRL